MAIDPRILEEALRAEQEMQRDGGISDMLTPQFNPTQYAEAGALPDLNLEIDNTKCSFNYYNMLKEVLT